jgi:lipopolysaccharide transport system ATP-binding protein
MMLQKGKIMQIGEAEYVSNHYTKYLYEKQNKSNWWIEETKNRKIDSKNAQSDYYEKSSTLEGGKKKDIDFKISQNFNNRVAQFRCGNGAARITEVELINSFGEITNKISFGEKITIRVYIEYYKDTNKNNLSLGIGLRDLHGVEIIQFTTLAEDLKIGGKDINREIIEFQFENKLTPGDYSIAVGIAELTPSINWPPYYDIEGIVDYCPGCYPFKVPTDIEKPIWGKVGIPVDIQKYSI